MAPAAHASPCRAYPLVGLVFLGLLVGPAEAQDRRGRSTPGLVLDTGGRHAACDVLQFSPDGLSLMAAGDDKVVRLWDVEGNQLVAPKAGPRELRWPIYREQRGLIFAAALAPHRGDARLAVAGFGLKTGYVAILNRQTGEIELGLQEVRSDQPNWAIAWSPDARYVVFGNERGELYRWNVAKREKSAVPFIPSLSRDVNRVRLITFTERTQFLSLAQDGRLLEWDVTDPKARPRVRGRCQSPQIRSAAISPDRHWLAVAGEFTGRSPSAAKTPWENYVEVLDLPGLRAGRDPDACRHYIKLPDPEDAKRRHIARAVAFDDRGELLAVGMDEMPRVEEEADNFFRLTGGKVHVFRAATGKRVTPAAGLDVQQRPEALAFRPRNPDQLAVAGGDNHEVRLFDVKSGRALSTVRGAGAVPWAVALDAKNRYLGWREQRKPSPTNPNDRGSGPWRVLDLKASKMLPAAPADFRPVQPLASVDGWRVVPTRNNYVWRVVNDRRGKETDVRLDETDGLYPRAVNQLPMCYTFLPRTATKPVRLVVGHWWGATVYECRPGRVTLARALLGHEGPVTGVAASADGQLLVTASRDLTLACWSLADWPKERPGEADWPRGHRELGARFVRSRSGGVEVGEVHPGSPAWEAGLVKGDELDVVLLSEPTQFRGSAYVRAPGKQFKHEPAKGALSASFMKDGERQQFQFGVREKCDADTILKRLAESAPRRWHFFAWKQDGKERFEATTVQQRPLWRLFSTRKAVGDHFVIWRWRDFYYDTSSTVADHLLGWHVNAAAMDRKPQFHPLERFRGTDPYTGEKGARFGFHRPDKVWPTVLRTFQAPDRVQFAEIEPPEVQVRVVQAPTAAADLQVRVTARSTGNSPRQQLERVTLWINDFRYNRPPTIKGGQINETLTIPRGVLRQGESTVTVQCYTVQGGRGQASDRFTYKDATRGARELLALCVGINDYSRARVQGRPSSSLRLNCSKPDALELCEIFSQHEKSALYRKALAEPLIDRDATKKAVVARITAIGQRVKPDDLFVLFLSGHGFAKEAKEGTYIPHTFYFLCADTDTSKEQTKLTSEELRNVLGGINCRKLIILDACHSGSLAKTGNPVRDLDEGLGRFLILSASEPHQLALEPQPGKGEMHGVFTQSLLKALTHARKGKVGGRQKEVTAEQLGAAIRKYMPDILDSLGVPSSEQTPVFFPERLPPDPVLCKP